MEMIKTYCMVMVTARVKFRVTAKVMVRSGCFPLHDPDFPSRPPKVRVTSSDPDSLSLLSKVRVTSSDPDFLSLLSKVRVTSRLFQPSSEKERSPLGTERGKWLASMWTSPFFCDEIKASNWKVVFAQPVLTLCSYIRLICNTLRQYEPRSFSRLASCLL